MFRQVGFAEDHRGAPEGMGEIRGLFSGEKLSSDFAVFVDVFLMSLGNVSDVASELFVIQGFSTTEDNI